MTREEAFNRLEQMYDFYARAMDSDKNHPFEGDAEAIKVALLVIAQDRSAHITREQVEKMRRKWMPIHGLAEYYCSCCGVEFEIHSYDKKNYRFCPYCGAPMTDKAVDILWKQLEAMRDGEKTD